MIKNMLVIAALFSMYSINAMMPGNDFVDTPTQFAFIQDMNQDLQTFMNSLAADRQLFQSWNIVLVDLTGSLHMYEQQHNDAINQVKLTIGQLQLVLADQERQGQDYQVTINALSEQLDALQQQTDQEILALQQQLDNTTLELDMLEDEYGDFIDASFEHAQEFYNMLQMAKEEYAALLSERTLFFNSLQSLTDALHTHSQGTTTELYELVNSFQQPAS